MKIPSYELLINLGSTLHYSWMQSKYNYKSGCANFCNFCLRGNICAWSKLACYQMLREGYWWREGGQSRPAGALLILIILQVWPDINKPLFILEGYNKSKRWRGREKWSNMDLIREAIILPDSSFFLMIQYFKCSLCGEIYAPLLGSRLVVLHALNCSSN